LALPHYDTSLSGQPVSWEGVKRCAEKAEAAGLDSVWVSDHLFLDWSKYGGPDDVQGALECWTTLSALAASTSSIRIGSLTLCNDFRNPGLVAKMAATLDLLSQGRLELGLGAGWYEPEYRAAGIVLDSPGTRIRRAGEAIEIIARLLEGEVLRYKGDHYALDGAICRPLPAQRPRPRIWLGGKGDLLLDTAVRVADGWNFSWLGSIEAYEERAHAADLACERHGRDPSDLARSAGVYLVAGRDESDARKRFERLVERTPPGVLATPRGGSGVSWDEFRRDHIAGGVQEVVDRLGRLAELGVEEIIVSLGTLPFQLEDEEDIEVVGAMIAPAIK
jgi:alkanesulfonate monooxygenase SsuD/methylene tetrahydromethanopterin reductase-like flavin-dependent oxidoreductase (luciferase family)